MRLTRRRRREEEDVSGLPPGKEAIRSAYTYLLCGLIATALIVPFVHRGRAGALVLNALVAAVIAAGVAAAATRRRYVVVALVLAVPAVALSVLEVSEIGGPSAALRHGLQTAFFAYTAWIILIDVLRRGRVTAEKIRGAVCVLLLIGATWAFAYLTLLRIDPGAFSFPASTGARVTGASGDTGYIGDILYFSFINLTSVGYGDILPVSPVARSMSWMEALMGQLYMTLLVARLVGLHIAHDPRPED